MQEPFRLDLWTLQQLLQADPLHGTPLTELIEVDRDLFEKLESMQFITDALWWQLADRRMWHAETFCVSTKGYFG